MVRAAPFLWRVEAKSFRAGTDPIGPAGDVDEDHLSCAVCFEDLPAGGVAVLPCVCRIPYCHSCWDRALNTKFDTTGRAECPSCRSSMRADFNVETGQLVFTKLAAAGHTEALDANMRDRLYEQARPRQLRLLRACRRPVVDSAPTCDSISLGPECVCGRRLKK